MRRLVFVIAATAMMAGASALAVRHGDRELTVPPPESIAESFMRNVLTHRYPRARDLVVEQNADEEAMRRLAQSIEQRLGRVDDVSAETVSRTKEVALVNVRLKSASASDAVPLSMIWSNGAWNVERVP
jgi:hypothetical protein